MSSAVQQLTYSWDGFGNLEVRQDVNQEGACPNNQSGLCEELTYDNLNRLTGSKVTNSAGNGPNKGVSTL